jgi:hypothetical protein
MPATQLAHCQLKPPWMPPMPPLRLSEEPVARRAAPVVLSLKTALVADLPKLIPILAPTYGPAQLQAVATGALKIGRPKPTGEL